MQHHAIVIFLVLLASGFSSTVQAEAYGSGWYGEIQASYGYEDNIARTYQSDTLDERVASVSIGGGYSNKISDREQLILSSYVTYNEHDDYDALTNLAISVGLDYTMQRTVGYGEPWYRLQVSFTNFEYRDSDKREGVLFHADISANKRITPSLTGHMGLRHNNYFFVGKSSREEEDHDTFKADASELYAGFDLQMSRRVVLFGELAFRHGDLRSTVSGGQASPGTEYDAETIDDIFDPPCTRRCTFSYAYRTRGDTYLANLGLAFPMPGFNSINMDLTLSHYEAESDLGKTYRNSFVKLGLLWNF